MKLWTVYFSAYVRGKRQKRIKHLYHQCELPSDLSEASVEVCCIWAGEWGGHGELRRVFEEEEARWQKEQ